MNEPKISSNSNQKKLSDDTIESKSDSEHGQLHLKPSAQLSITQEELDRGISPDEASTLAPYIAIFEEQHTANNVNVTRAAIHAVERYLTDTGDHDNGVLCPTLHFAQS